VLQNAIARSYGHHLKKYLDQVRPVADNESFCGGWCAPGLQGYPARPGMPAAGEVGALSRCRTRYASMDCKRGELISPSICPSENSWKARQVSGYPICRAIMDATMLLDLLYRRRVYVIAANRIQQGVLKVEVLWCWWSAKADTTPQFFSFPRLGRESSQYGAYQKWNWSTLFSDFKKTVWDSKTVQGDREK